MAVKINAKDGDWELWEILGQDALFSNYRIDRSTLPEGVYAYDLRDADDQSCTPSELKDSVLVNHMGTVLVRNPVKNSTEGVLIGPDDYNVIGGEMTIEEFIAGDYEKE